MARARLARWSAVVCAAAGVVAALAGPSSAQPAAAGAPFTLEQVRSYPFPNELTAAATGNRIAWAMNEQGARNIFVAEAPAWVARRLAKLPGRRWAGVDVGVALARRTPRRLRPRRQSRFQLGRRGARESGRVAGIAGRGAVDGAVCRGRAAVARAGGDAGHLAACGRCRLRARCAGLDGAHRRQRAGDAVVRRPRLERRRAVGPRRARVGVRVEPRRSRVHRHLP